MGDLCLYPFPQPLGWVWVICAHFPRPGLRRCRVWVIYTYMRFPSPLAGYG
nr:MAG TPA: hypothetical protein [Caudoviricetes sp.]